MTKCLNTLSVAAWAVAWLLMISTGTAYADDAADSLAKAYEAGRQDGYAQGWAACQTARCGGSIGWTVSPGSTAMGGSTVYQIPKIFVGGGTTGSKPVPDNWLINSSESGPQLFGRVDSGGTFQPYVIDKSGQIDLLPENEAPLWTTDQATKSFFQSLPKSPDGTVYVPLEPFSK